MVDRRGMPEASAHRTADMALSLRHTKRGANNEQARRRKEPSMIDGVFGGLTGPPAQMSTRYFADTAADQATSSFEHTASIPAAFGSAASSHITFRTGCSLSSITTTA